MPRHSSSLATLPVSSPGTPTREPGAALDGHQPPRFRRPDLKILHRLLEGLKHLPDEPPGEKPPPQAEKTQPAAPPDEAIAAVRESFAAVREAGDRAIAYFYARLFLTRPSLRDLFPAAMDEQRDRLLAALIRIVESLSTPDEMTQYLEQLGRDHMKYGVEPSMYEVLGDALNATLREFAGAAFTAAAEEAWREVYATVSAIMIRAAGEAPGPAWWTAEVVDHDDRGSGVAVVTAEPDQPLPYQPGQFLTVQHPRWARMWRPYSVACVANDDGRIRFHVKRVPLGWVSGALVDPGHTRPGTELILGPPLGGMTLDHAGGRDLLLVAGGTGLSCVKALAEQAVRDALTGGPARRIYLYWGARTRAELYDLRSLWRFADAYSGLEVIPVTSDDLADSGRLQGNIGGVAAWHLPRSDCEAYVAGPEPMVRDTIRALTRKGLPPGRIHFDSALLGSGT